MSRLSYTRAISREVLDEVVVGKGCRIGKNCRLKYCVLMDGVQLGDGCVLSDCVLDSGCVLDAGCTLAHCVVGRGVRLGEFFTATGRLVHKWARRGRVRRSEPPVEDEALAALIREIAKSEDLKRVVERRE